MRDAALQIDILPASRTGSVILRLHGPLTLLNIFSFQDRVRAIDAPLTILDFEGVPYMDSAGLGAVVNFYVSSGNRGRKIALAAVNDRVLALFEQTKVDKVLTFLPTVAASEGD